MLGIRLYASDHRESFPETLEDTAPYIGGTNLLERIVGAGNAGCLIYLRAPGQISERNPHFAAVIAPMENGCWIGRGDGSVWLTRKSAVNTLSEECQQLAKAQPGMTAVLSVGPGIVKPDVERISQTLKEAGFSVMPTEEIPLAKRIRIQFSAPDSVKE